MAEIKTDFIDKCLSSLELASQHLQSYKSTDDMYDIFRAACYGDYLADRIILIFPEFINDAKNFVKAVQKQNESKT
jgi:hypothetical protein